MSQFFRALLGRSHAAANNPGGYAFYRAITIDHTKVGASDSTNFPLLVSSTISSLATVANGGRIQDPNGYDVAFFSDSGLTTQLKHETEKWVSTTGEVIYDVKIPTVSHTADTVIYMAYGNSGISTDQSDKTNVWTNSFTGVYHLPDGTTLSANDSTANASNGTINLATATSGQIDGAGNFSNATNQYIHIGVPAATGTPITMSAWVKLASATFTGELVISSIVKLSGTDEFWLSYVEFGGSRYIRVVAQQSGTAYEFRCPVTPDTNWHLIHGTFTDANTMAVYMDGAALSGSFIGTSGRVPASLDNTYLGVVFHSSSLHFGTMNGAIDEARFATVVRSADWITAEYNNQSSPSTFYTVGAETAT